MGHEPDWYKVITAARFLRVAPWDLLRQPVVWQEWARGAMSAEGEARRQHQARSNRQQALGT